MHGLYLVVCVIIIPSQAIRNSELPKTVALYIHHNIQGLIGRMFLNKNNRIAHEWLFVQCIAKMSHSFFHKIIFIV